jgi:8-oxo-dGTP diphosphatase
VADLTPAASAIIVHGNEILFVRSKRTREKWAFPGGKSEEDENPEDTARREAKEEVGLDIELTQDLGRYVIPYETGGFEISCFAGVSSTADLKLDPDEILEARWVTLGEGRGL